MDPLIEQNEAGIKLYEAWNKLWVERTGSNDRPWSQMSSEDPREACMWEDFAEQVELKENR